jgi:two-component system sensor kinase FixL
MDHVITKDTRNRSLNGKGPIAMVLAILLLTFSVCAVLYSLGTRTVVGDSQTLHRIQWLVIELATTAVLGAGGLVAVLLKSFSNWHRSRLKEVEEEKGHENQKTIAILRAGLIEAREAEAKGVTLKEELQKHIEALTTSNAALQEDLNKRNRAEKALAQKRQELESSNSVLEVHVQARTKELQKLQRRYELILNSAGEGICGLDLDGRATFVNPAVARITGWQIEELIGKREEEIFNQKGSNNGHTTSFGPPSKELVFRRKNGSSFPVEFVRTPLNEDGKVVGSVLIFKDITERRRVEIHLSNKAEELARSNAELEQFAFVASHDLQEPLRKIQAFGDRLKTKVEGAQAADARDYLDRMQKAAARMQTLINDLLAFSRVIRSSEPFMPVNLQTVTKEVLGDLEVRIEKSGATVEVGDLGTIDADPLQMRQLFLNLISNALKFQAPGSVPLVNVTSRKIPREEAAALGPLRNGVAEELCEIRIKDNGIGFDEVYLDKIFAVFQRLHGRSEYEGTGVGLAVCRRIADRHGGTIIARSKPGQGALFIVTLPVHQTKPEAVQ